MSSRSRDLDINWRHTSAVFNNASLQFEEIFDLDDK